MLSSISSSASVKSRLTFDGFFLQPLCAMAGVKKEERREDRKFVALPPETVQVVADSVGVGNVAPAVAAALSEDASYRVRELAHVSQTTTIYLFKLYLKVCCLCRFAASCCGTARGRSSRLRM